MTERDDAPDDDDPDSDPEAVAAPRRGRWGNAVGAGSVALITVGILLIAAHVPVVQDPDGWLCSGARGAIERANDDDEDYNDVDLGDAGSVDDLDCDEALALAGTIRVDADSDDTLSITSSSAARTIGIVGVLIGLVLVAGGVGTVSTHNRWFRRAGLIGAVVALPFVGLLIGPLLVGFVIWSLYFSARARAIWGELSWVGGSRRSRGA